MRTRTAWMVVVGVVMVGALQTSDAWAFGRGRMGEGKGAGMRMMQGLDLSAAQKEQVEQLTQQMKQDLAPVREQLDQKRNELHQLWRAEAPNEQAILAKMAEMDGLRQQVRARNVKFRLAVHALLTPEQKARMAERMGQGRGGRHHGMGGGPGMGWWGDQD